MKNPLYRQVLKLFKYLALLSVRRGNGSETKESSVAEAGRAELLYQSCTLFSLLIVKQGRIEGGSLH